MTKPRPRPRLCRPHETGVSHGCPPFYSEGCERCQANLAAGKVTGLEGPLPKNWFRKMHHTNPGFSRKSKIIIPFHR